MSQIEWTERTWNPIAGCSIVSPGCTNCYAMRMAARIERMNPGLTHYQGLTQPSKAGQVWTGKVALAPERTLFEPLRRKKPTTYFVNSMSDLFHEDVPDEWIDRVFAVMALCPQHTFQVLTKRSARMRAYCSEVRETWCKYAENAGSERILGHICRLLKRDNDDYEAGASLAEWPLPNIWLGVLAEDQRRADERIPDLLATPAAVRFVSAEPLLGPIDFIRDRLWHGSCRVCRSDGTAHLCTAGDVSIDWIIVGGESGPGARPMHPDWARSIRDQCHAAGVPFFFKQWGAWTPNAAAGGRQGVWLSDDGRLTAHMPRGGCVLVTNVGKASAGRLLDGIEWSELPRQHPAAPIGDLVL